MKINRSHVQHRSNSQPSNQTAGRLDPGPHLRDSEPHGGRKYRRLPIFGRIIDDFVAWSRSRGYSPATLDAHLLPVRGLALWFQRRGRRSCQDLTADDLAAARQVYRVRKPHWVRGIARWGEFLRTRGWLKRGVRHRPTPSDKVVHQFVRHLRKDRGLAEGTIRWHRRYLRYFLNSLGFDRGRMIVRELELIHVHRFVRQMSRRCSRLTMKSVVDFIRGFLRFQFLKGALRQPLHTRIDTVRVYQEERLPHPLPWAELQKLLGRMDRSTALGSRDFTILLLAAAYGLRQSELAALTLDDLDWRARRVRISQSKTRQTLLLPLTDEVGAALVDYLRRGRPASADRHLFLRQRAPLGPLGVTGVARRLGWAVQTTGVKIGTMSFHGLRHAFALRLLRQGTALKNISDLLGHRDPNSTASYLRLNLDDFRPVALPVPRPRVAETKRRAASRLPTQPVASKALRRAAGTVTDTTGLDSFLAKSLRDYLATQRALGRAYRHVEWILRTLDWVLRRDFPNGRIFTKAMFDRWAMKQAVLSPTGRRYRMLSVRKFCLFLARLRPTTFVPNLKSFPKALPPQAPYLLTRSEMSRILTKTKTVKLGWQNPFRRQTMRLAWVLLYCCGLRRGELLRLRLADLDVGQRVLRIHQTKFYKSRWVPFSPSVGRELRQYLAQRRRRHLPMEPASPLLWNGRADQTGGPLCAATLVANWYGICRCAGVLDHRGRPPRIHDLRHSFAVEALHRSYAAGRDPQATLPLLARYLGHVSFRFTHHYLKFTEPLRHAASERFRKTVAPSVFNSQFQKGRIL
jgi:integrase